MTEIISFALGMIVMALAVIVCAGIVLLTRPATAERLRIPALRGEKPVSPETLVSPEDNKPHPVIELAPPSIEQRRREAEMRQRAQEQRTREDLTKVATLG